MRIVVATRNVSKVQQIRALFAGSSLTLVSLNEAGIDGKAPETGRTLRENAAEKAWFAYERMITKGWTMSDDTGLFINALNGLPGVRAAVWGGDDITPEERMAYCLKQMNGLSDRSATFRTCVVLISPDAQEYVFFGEASGRLLEKPRVPPQPMMPYSALFVPNRETRSWAEMSTEEENALSHRGKAFAQVRAVFDAVSSAM